MDDKTLIAEYAAGEMIRINQRLKEMLESEKPPSEEMRKNVIEDIETTLSRVQRALANINISADSKEEKYNEQ